MKAAPRMIPGGKSATTPNHMRVIVSSSVKSTRLLPRNDKVCPLAAKRFGSVTGLMKRVFSRAIMSVQMRLGPHAVSMDTLKL